MRCVLRMDLLAEVLRFLDGVRHLVAWIAVDIKDLSASVCFFEITFAVFVFEHACGLAVHWSEYRQRE